MHSRDLRPPHEPNSDADYDANDDDERSEVDEIDPDDAHWDAFLADEDELDPQPDPGDFWPED